MDTEQIKQMATDVNNVAAESFASGVRHTRRVLLPKIEQLQAKNKRLNTIIDNRAEDLEVKAKYERLKDIIEKALLEDSFQAIVAILADYDLHQALQKGE